LFRSLLRRHRNSPASAFQPPLGFQPRLISTFFAATRSCESTSRRKSTARLHAPPSGLSPAAPSFPFFSLYPFSSRRFISSGGARFRAHKSPRARNRKHPPSSISCSSSSSGSSSSSRVASAASRDPPCPAFLA